MFHRETRSHPLEKKKKRTKEEEGRAGRGGKLLLASQDGCGLPTIPGTGTEPGGGL
jgi:hypothetical protein